MSERPAIPRSHAALFASALLLLVVGGLELLARFSLEPVWRVRRKPAEDAILLPHADLGYALRPHTDRRWAHDDFDVHIALNERGMRDEPLAAARGAGRRVLAVGDSFTFGIGVEANEAWPARLEARLNDTLAGTEQAAVLNAGVPGYGARQMRLSMDALLPELEPELVVFGLYANSYWRVGNPYGIHGGTLITRDRVAATELLPDGGLVVTAFEPGWLRTIDVWLKRFFHFGAHTLALPLGGRHWPQRAPAPDGREAIAEAYAPALREIREARDLARDRGSTLVVLAIHAQRPDGSFDAREQTYHEILAAFCARHGILFVATLPELQARAAGRAEFRFPTDQHWSPAAHELAAGLVHQKLLAEGLVASPPIDSEA